MTKLIKTDYHPEVNIMEGKKVGCLLIHGWTSSPVQLGNLAIFLQRKGIWVRTPLLPGHGKTPEELNGVDFNHWVEAAEEEIKEFINYVDYLFIGGWSMGGNVALHLASKYPVKGVLSMATPIFLKGERMIKALLPIVSRFKPMIKKRYFYLSRRMVKERNSYDHIPLTSLKQLMDLIDETKKILTQINSPILMMQANDDKWVKTRSLDFLSNGINSEVRKKVVLIKKASHDLVLDKEQSEVYQEIFNFIISHVAKKTR